MKKLNLSVWLIALMTFPVISLAQLNDFSLYFYNSQKQRRFEQSTNYLMLPFPRWQMQVSGRNLEDKRIDFNQTSRNSSLNLSLVKNSSRLDHKINTGYEYLYDYSNLESELNPYHNKTGFLGYGIAYSPLDSLRFETNLKGYYRQEQDRYIEGHKLISRGYWEQVNGSYITGKANGYIQLGGMFENKSMNWEKYRLFSASLNSSLDNRYFNLNCLVNASARSENLYVLSSPDSTSRTSFYREYDEQKRKNLNASVNVFLPLGDYLDCQIVDNYTLVNYRHQENPSRNNGDYNNQAQVSLVYRLSDKVRILSNNLHNYYIKDLSYIKNTRIIDIRNSNLGINCEYLPSDSLSFDYTIELKRTTYPDKDHQLDNDYLSNIYKLGWILYWKERLRISNRFLYQERKEVFIDSWLAANSNTLKGYQWQPECDIMVGDRLAFRQEYLLRADYDDYYYNEFSNIRDTFYRQISATYHLVFDTSPLASKIDVFRWNLLPYRQRDNEALRIDLGYAWERNETSSKDDGVYYINGRYDKQTLGLLLQKQYGIVIGQLYPRYSWGSWEEYNLLLSLSWQLNSNSILELDLNPVGSEPDNLDWRLSCSLNLIF